MTNNWLSEWSNSKIDIALKLSKGGSGGTYAEAVIILCSVISGISADIWPGKNRDKKRFVELLVNYSNDSLKVKNISIPLLIASLEEKGLTAESDQIFNEIMPKSKTLVITGEDVDKSEDYLLDLYPEIDREIVKRNSYANILYEELRSAYVHEYMPGARSDSFAMASNNANGQVSYINRADKPHRLIYFNVSWLCELINSIVANLEKKDVIPVFTDYSEWWLTDT
jgi:hypothetical protein